MKKYLFPLFFIITFFINNPQILSQQDDPTVRRAIYMIKKGECAQALKFLDMSLKKYGDSEMVYLYLGQAYECLFMTEDAMENYNKSLELNENYERALFSRGKLYITQDDIENGCNDLKAAFNLGYEKDKDFFMEKCPESAEEQIKDVMLVYKFESDDFSIYFPKMYEDSFNEDEGFSFTSIFCERENSIYMVTHWDYGSDFLNENEDINQIMKDMTNGMTTGMFPGGKITYTKKTFKGNSGFDFFYKTKDAVMAGVIFTYKSQIYFLSNATQNSEINRKELEIFVESLVLKN
jgi:tetratricopeptide (TPR) repeat protein